MGEAARAWLEVRGLSKEFGGVQALRGVDFELRPGHVHGLAGANGAGKSTFVRCLAGLIVPDAGTIAVDGQRVEIASPARARALGFDFIHQELNLVPRFDAVQNMLLGRRKRSRLGLLDRRAARRQARAVADRLGIAFPLERPVAELSVAERWMVSIGRALIAEPRMIAMDEPTASLSQAESERLFGVVRDLSRSGVSVLYVSHRLAEVIDLCDAITVFRDGLATRRAGRGELDRVGLVREIVGHDLRPEEAAEETARERERATAASAAEPPVLELRGVSRAPRVHDVSFSLRRGEVLGLGGLVGAGRTEVARLIAGADRIESGELLLDGERINPRGVAEAVGRGIALVPEERRSEALLLDRSVTFNLNIADLKALRRVSWLPVLDRRRARERARASAERLRIQVADLAEPVASLSGGNQQKVLIARWLNRGMRVLILDELSRGVDVGARAEIHRIVRSLGEQGTSVIAISSEIEELVELCDRVVVLAEGRVAGELEKPELSQENVISLSYRHAHREMEALT